MAADGMTAGAASAIDPARPCSGMRVIAATTALAAPFAAYQLALHGAEVINVEEPAGGDSARRAGGPEGKALIANGMAAGFLAHGANKQSLTLNLKDPRGQAIFRQLAAGADVVIENFRVGTMARYGLDYPSLEVLNPRLVYCSLSGFGQSGPRARAAALDPVIQAASGLMTVTGTPESGPLKVGATIMDYAAGYALLSGLLMALLHRERCGRGQYVDVSMLETSLTMMSSTVSEVMNTGMQTRLMGNQLQNGNHVCDSFRCADGWIFIGATRESLRQKLWKAIGRPDIPVDPRFRGIDEIRANIAALKPEIEKTLATRSAAEWERILEDGGVPAMRVYSIAEITADAQITGRGFYHTMNPVPGVSGPVRMATSPYRLSRGGAEFRSPPPRLGEHSDAILQSLGYDAAAIAALRADRVI